MQIPVIKSRQFILRPFRKEDTKSLAKNINNKKIACNTLTIPYPYKLKDAKEWLRKTLKEKGKKKSTKVNFAIDINEEVVGSVSLEKIEDHKAEIGYWLAEEHWGKGITTEVVKLATKFGFSKLKLKRIYAYVFSHNKASMKVLRKAGYNQEGFLRKHVKKGKQYMDDYIFAKVR